MADERLKVSTQAASVFADLLESLLVDVATEAHRAARLGFDHRLNVEEEEELRLSAHARAIVGESGSGGIENGSKHGVDVFGQSHPTIASDTFDCMNCGRPIVAGRFAPHLEKCMGKGRKARLKANKSINLSQQQQQQRVRKSSMTSLASGMLPTNRIPNRTGTRIPDYSQRVGGETSNASDESQDDDEKDLSYGLPNSGKTRLRKTIRETSAQTGGSLRVLGPMVRGANAASAASLPSSSATVEVAIEQFHPVAGEVPTSGDMVLKKGGKQKSNVKGRRVVEKKKHMGQVLAGSSPILEPKVAGRREYNSVTRITDAETIAPVQRSPSHNGAAVKPRSDSGHEMYRNGDGQSQSEPKLEPKFVDSVVIFSNNSIKGSGGSSVGPRPLGVGMKKVEDQDRDEAVDFGKRKKRPRPILKPKRSGGNPAGITTK